MMVVRLLDDLMTRVDEAAKTTRRVKFRESFCRARASSIVVTGRLKAFGDDTDVDADGGGLTPRVATACDDDVEIELRDVLACRCHFTAPKPDARGFTSSRRRYVQTVATKSTYAMLYDASFQMRTIWRARGARVAASPRATVDSSWENSRATPADDGYSERRNETTMGRRGRILSATCCARRRCVICVCARWFICDVGRRNCPRR